MAAIDVPPAPAETPRQRRVRLALAVVVAPLVTIPMMCLGGILRGHDPQFEPSELAMMAVIYLPFAYAGALVLGLPLHFWFRRTGLGAWWAYALCGAAIATLPVALPQAGQFATRGDWAAIELAGVLAGVVFRAIVGPAPARLVGAGASP